MPAKKKPKPLAPPTLVQCMNALGEAPALWEGRCYEIATKLVKVGLVRGVAVYGHWIGPISPKSKFAPKASVGFAQHGWIVLDADAYEMDKGAVLDPTRWAFEAVQPYIFVGAPDSAWDPTLPCERCDLLEEEHRDGYDHCGEFKRSVWPYDEGGNQFRERTLRPPPQFDATQKVRRLTLSNRAAAHVGLLLGQDNGRRITDQQMLWLANAPYQRLGAHVGEIYREIYRRRPALIPMDNLERAKREAGLA